MPNSNLRAKKATVRETFVASLVLVDDVLVEIESSPYYRNAIPTKIIDMCAYAHPSQDAKTQKATYKMN